MNNHNNNISEQVSENDFLWSDNQPIKINDGDKKMPPSQEEVLAGINHSAMQELLQRKDDVFNEQPDEMFDDENFNNSKLPTEIIQPSFEERIIISKSKLNSIKKYLKNIQENSRLLNELLETKLSEEVDKKFFAIAAEDDVDGSEETSEGKVLEGVFNGTHMIGPDGKQYTIPANYASKSKLVEGDILKLTITDSGRFIYKQIGPIERVRIVGRLKMTANSEYYVYLDDGRQWRILTASVTYFKGSIEDEAVILVPKHGESVWAAVENIVGRR